MHVLLLFVLVALVEARVLRRGITQVVAPAASATSSASGTFNSVTFAPPSGNTAPPPQTTTSAFVTYSASFPPVTFSWAASQYTFDTTNIANMNPQKLGSNFAIIQTAGVGR